MRVAALLAVRNEANYIDRAIRHLISEGVDILIIDNESTDNTLEIAKSYLGRGVARIYRQPYSGFFDLVAQCKLKEEIANTLDYDWFIHCDADEIHESPWPGVSLMDAIKRVDDEGFNAISYDEFVFIPTSRDESFEGADYVEQMNYYYYFVPWTQHLVRAWKRSENNVMLSHMGGHYPEFEGRRIYENRFILRHYIVLSLAHAKRKYGVERRYSDYEKNELRWHGWRGRFHDEMFQFPTRDALSLYLGNKIWDRTNPTSTNLFVNDSKRIIE